MTDLRLLRGHMPHIVVTSARIESTIHYCTYRSEESRLDAWAAQRHQVARDVVALTDRMTRVATMKSPTGKALRNVAVLIAGYLPPVRAAVARTLAELT